MVVGINFSRGIEDAWAKVAAFVPKLFGFLLILLIGFFIAKMIAKVAASVLERVGFDRLVERGGVGKKLEASKFDPSTIIGKVIFYALMLIVLQMAFGVFGTNPVSDLITGVIAYLPKVLVAIIIILIAAAAAAAVKELVDAALGGLSYGKALGIGLSVAVMAIGVFAALDQLQIAPRIVSGLFYALLATVVGSAIIAIGGGGITPMRRRWESTLERYDAEKQNLAQESKGAKERIQARFEERKEQAKGQQPPQPPQPQQPPAGARSLS